MMMVKASCRTADLPVCSGLSVCVETVMMTLLTRLCECVCVSVCVSVCVCVCVCVCVQYKCSSEHDQLRKLPSTFYSAHITSALRSVFFSTFSTLRDSLHLETNFNLNMLKF